MIKYIINIKHYWNIVLIIDIDYDRYDVVESALKDIDAPIKVIDDIYNKIGYQYDSGFTFSNSDFRTSVVGINKTTSKEEMINTISHEADHIQTAVCDYYNIRLDSESAAYLIGYIIQQFYKYCYNCFCNS